MTEVLIDPGHGGKDPGAQCAGIREADLNLQMAIQLRDLLLRAGVATRLTREEDTTMSLEQRVLIEHTLSPGLFLSLHCNAAASAAASGFEVWTSPGETFSDAVAEDIFQQVASLCPELPRRFDAQDGDHDREKRLFVLSQTRCPAVLVEAGFLTNEADRELLLNPAFRSRILYGVATGVLSWQAARGAA